MLGRTDRRLRMVAMLLVFAIFGGAATVRLGYWQVVAAPALAIEAERSIARPKVAAVPRARIIDRDGVVLAQSATLDQLQAHPNLIPEARRDGVVRTLAEIMGISVSAARKAYGEKLASGSQWEWLERTITLEQSVEVRLAKDQGLLPGISLAPQQVRIYPRKGGEEKASLANQLLGFVDAEGRGMYGIEALYDARLTGEDSNVDLASIGGIGSLGAGAELPPLRLTIDAKLQRQVESELFATRLATRAKSVSAIVMDPRTGAILASASVPGYDANDFATVARRSPGKLRDRIVSDFYEPGSVMKIFTVTAALDQGVVTPQTRISDEVKIRFYEDVIQNADHKSKGRLKVKDVIALSRNVATAKIAQRLAPKNHQKAARRLYDLWQRVGVVGKTDVDIFNESAGLGYDPNKYLWAPVDLANRAFGQGVAVTLMQLATGLSTIVNGGYRVQPHVVADGNAASVPPRRVLTPKVARQARDILVHVTGSVPWYAKGSLIPGYMIGGKTGTAQIWDSSRGDWKDDIFNHSFIGFVGSDEPEAVIAVRLEEPKVKVSGQGLVDSRIESYELFRMIAHGAIKHLDIQRSSDRQAGLPILGTAASKTLTPQREATARQRHRQARRNERDTGARKASGSSRKGKESGRASATGRQGQDGDRAARQARSSGGSGT